MATESDWICPVCHEARSNVARVTPCQHKFCFGCIMWWARINPICLLCKTQLNSILFSVWSNDDFVEVLREPSDDGQEDEEGAAEEQPQTYVAGLLPENWAALFRDEPQLIDALRPWLLGQLSEMSGAAWWEVALLEATVITQLCHYGLHKEAFVWELQPSLGNQTERFVLWLIDVAIDWCSRQVLHQMQLDFSTASEWENSMESDLKDSQDAGEWEDSPVDTPGETPPHPSTVSSHHPGDTDDEELPSTLEPLKQLGQAAAAEPAAQGCSHSPSAPGQGRERSPGESQQPPKRRAGSTPDSPQPCKRPPP